MVMMVFMVIPVIAPSIGQLIMIFGDWSEIFIAMAVLAIVFGTWAAIRLPETLAPENRRELTFSSVTRGFGYVLTNRVALCYTLATTSIFGSLFGFISSAQQIYTDTFDLADWFPILFAIGAGLMAISSFTNSRLVGRIGMRRLSHTALVGFTAVSLLWLVLASIATCHLPCFSCCSRSPCSSSAGSAQTSTPSPWSRLAMWRARRLRHRAFLPRWAAG